MQVDCPKDNKPVIHRHENFALIESEILEWGIISNAYQCRVVISASENLNGQLLVEIYSINDASIRVYQMPNNFNTDIYDTKGILENNRINITDKPAIYKVPTDWTIVLQYNVGFLGGHIKLRSWAQQYKQEDQEWLDTMHPTGTYWIDPEQEAREREEEKKR